MGNVWNTKAWRDRRDELVKGVSVCKWCEEPFTGKNPAAVHHLKETGIDRLLIRKQAFDNILGPLIEKELNELPYCQVVYKRHCPGCERESVYYRKTIGSWKCQQCGLIFTKSPLKCVRVDRLPRDLFDKLWRENKVKVSTEVNRQRKESFEKYMELAPGEVIVICKKCHFVWTKYRIKRGDPLHTCKKCGGVKRSKRFNLCFRCAGAEEKIFPSVKIGPPESFFDEADKTEDDYGKPILEKCQCSAEPRFRSVTKSES